MPNRCEERFIAQGLVIAVLWVKETRNSAFRIIEIHSSTNELNLYSSFITFPPHMERSRSRYAEGRPYANGLLHLLRGHPLVQPSKILPRHAWFRRNEQRDTDSPTNRHNHCER